MKKFLASLLALMLLAMPFAGLAESAPAMDLSALLTETEDHYTCALESGRRIKYSITASDVATDLMGEPAMDQVIADVLNALVISGYVQGEETGYSIGMEQADGTVYEMLGGATLMEGDDYYINNTLTGAMVVGKEEWLPLLERLIDMLAMIGMYTEEDAAAMKAELPAIAEEFTAMLNPPQTEEFDFAALDYSALVEAFTVVAGKMETGAPDVLPRNCDPAVAMATVTMTPDEMKGLIAAAIQFIKDNPDLADYISDQLSYEYSIAPSMAGVAGETPSFTEVLDQAIAELENEDIYAADTVIRIWMGEDGMPVAMQCTSAAYGDDGEPAEFTINYSRLTMNDAVAHTCTLVLPEGGMTVNYVDKGADFTANLTVVDAKGKTPVEMNIECTDRSADNLEACTAVVDIVVVGDGDNLDDAADAVTTKIKLDVVSDTVFAGVDFLETTAVTITVNGNEILTVNVNAASVDAAASIKDGDVVRPATLSDADFANWFVGVYTTLYSWPQQLMYALPSSVINLMTTGY